MSLADIATSATSVIAVIGVVVSVFYHYQSRIGTLEKDVTKINTKVELMWDNWEEFLRLSLHRDNTPDLDFYFDKIAKIGIRGLTDEECKELEKLIEVESVKADSNKDNERLWKLNKYKEFFVSSNKFASCGGKVK